MKRYQIANKIQARLKSIQKLKSEILELERANLLLSDRNQHFVETEEEILASDRPKIYEKKLVGRIFWREKFKDEDNPRNYVMITRSKCVRVDGEWI